MKKLLPKWQNWIEMGLFLIKKLKIRQLDTNIPPSRVVLQKVCQKGVII